MNYKYDLNRCSTLRSRAPELVNDMFRNWNRFSRKRTSVSGGPRRSEMSVTGVEDIWGVIIGDPLAPSFGNGGEKKSPVSPTFRTSGESERGVHTLFAGLAESSKRRVRIKGPGGGNLSAASSEHSPRVFCDPTWMIVDREVKATAVTGEKVTRRLRFSYKSVLRCLVRMLWILVFWERLFWGGGLSPVVRSSVWWTWRK